MTEKTKSGASFISGGNTIEETLCLKIMNFKFTVQNDLNGLSTDRLRKVCTA
jgi:hypothetical protein